MNKLLLLTFLLIIGCSSSPRRLEVEPHILEIINSKNIDKGYSRVRFCSGISKQNFLTIVPFQVPPVKILVDTNNSTENLTTLNNYEQVVIDFNSTKRVHITTNTFGNVSINLIPKSGTESFITFDTISSRYDPNKEYQYTVPPSSNTTYVSGLELVKDRLDDSRCMGKKITFYKKID